MTPLFALFTFVNAWFISMFAVLPFRLGWKRTVLWDTLLAAVITLGLHLLLKSGWVPLREG